MPLAALRMPSATLYATLRVGRNRFRPSGNTPGLLGAGDRVRGRQSDMDSAAFARSGARVRGQEQDEVYRRTVEKTTTLLIPGADGHAWYWHLLVPQLTIRGYRPIAVEMPTSPDAGLTDYVDTAVDALRGVPEDLVVVAQSIGGFVAPLVCERVQVRLLILVNAMVPRPGESAAQWWEATGHSLARKADAARVGRRSDAEFDLLFDFFHDVPPAVTAEAMSVAPSAPSDQFFADPWPLTQWPSVPTRFLQGRDDRFFPLEFQRSTVRERLGIAIDEIPGGHLNALSEPAALADAIDNVIRDSR
jgi:pimeloyl-ACP methyl ester carboxylesterase